MKKVYFCYILEYSNDDMEKLETERLVKLMTLGSKFASLIDKAGAVMPSLKQRS